MGWLYSAITGSPNTVSLEVLGKTEWCMRNGARNRKVWKILWKIEGQKQGGRKDMEENPRDKETMKRGDEGTREAWRGTENGRVFYLHENFRMVNIFWK